MYRSLFKRIIDIVLSASAIALLSPVLAIVALGVRITSPGPAIFRQQRTGEHGRTFTVFKFRSMPLNTGDFSSDLIGEVEITPFGRLIRRTSLDELPQLFNILRGDMSIVGPRPPIPTQYELIELRRQNGALACRPGLTGLAQINGYDGMGVPEKAHLDGLYAQRLSFLEDVSIILRTFSYLTRPPPTY